MYVHGNLCVDDHGLVFGDSHSLTHEWIALLSMFVQIPPIFHTPARGVFGMFRRLLVGFCRNISCVYYFALCSGL